MGAVLKGVEIVSNTMTSRTVRKLFNDLFRQQGQEHAENTLPLHFEFGAYQRYKYKPRNSAYTRRKYRKYGHRNPNLLKGDWRRIILATARAGVTATHKGWQVRARGTQRHKMWGNTRDELEQISPSEEENYNQTNIRRFIRKAGTQHYRERTRRVIRK